MATRSTIAVKLANGQVQEVYAHWDGYIDHNGRLLQTHYNTQERAEAVTAQGGISSLAERITPIGAHSFDAAEEGTTVFYHRDRGEDDMPVNMFASVEDYEANVPGEEFDYLFADGAWTVRYNTDWVSLAQCIADEDAESEAVD